jgi:hypothetical protein
MTQIVLPLAMAGATGPSRIVIGNANAGVLDALEDTTNWPFKTAVLAGPPRSGKSLLAQWFAESGKGAVVDDAPSVDETELFHLWNRAQENGEALLLVSNSAWKITLPDLASRLGAALHLEIGEPDDAMIAELIAIHAEQRGLNLGEDAAGYLIPRCQRSHLDVERLVVAIDLLSLERKAPPTLAIWRDALDVVNGEKQPRLL